MEVVEDVDKVDVGVCCATDWREVDKSGWGKGKREKTERERERAHQSRWRWEGA